MNDDEYRALKASGKYKKESAMLLSLNDLYLKYLYLHSFNDIEAEKQRLRNIFN